VSFDVFFQGFFAGESSEHAGVQMREALALYISEENEKFFRVRVADGEADVYLHDGGMMGNHIPARSWAGLDVLGTHVAGGDLPALLGAAVGG
jgi:hypothetical protein